ncbi:hypothetical protein KQI42_03765 [Tissierella sp. MSJ-40]|uniref:YkoP-like domain-containing protein n=1 Tax=Tissierella simiarum TaxID=2841534 RepID=A0ABS6E2W0_9FIRM|nr:hypothetical protein [Tissierella simiarum]MBU5437112.1 hypothetical protein [Tissierella simiarum]
MNRLFQKNFEIIDRKIVEHRNWFHIPKTKAEVLYIAPHIYKGRDKYLPDGTVIKRGDLLAGIHIDNQKIKNMNINIKAILRLLDDELNCLSYAIVADTRFKDIKAFHGKTLFYPFLKREGFMIVDLDFSLNLLFVKSWEKMLRKTYSKNKIRKRVNREIKEFWITNDQLMDRRNRIGNEL